MKCQKCGCRKRRKQDLDSNGFCIDCSEDLSFKSGYHIITREEAEYRKLEERLSDKNIPDYDFVFFIVGCVFSALILNLFLKNNSFADLNFLNIFVRYLISIPIICLLSFGILSIGMVCKVLFWRVFKEIMLSKHRFIWILMLIIALSFIASIVTILKN